MSFISYFFVSIVTSIVWILYERFTCATGTLRIDHSNPEKDTYRFEIDNLESINKKRKVTLFIDHDANLSQD